MRTISSPYFSTFTAKPFIYFHIIIIISGVKLPRYSDLLQIRGALNAFCLLSRRSQCGQEHTGKNGDDRNHDEELYKGENPCFHPVK